jgi:hypothetical protein
MVAQKTEKLRQSSGHQKESVQRQPGKDTPQETLIFNTLKCGRQCTHQTQN